MPSPHRGRWNNRRLPFSDGNKGQQKDPSEESLLPRACQNKLDHSACVGMLVVACILRWCGRLHTQVPCISRQKPNLKDNPYHPLKQVYKPRQVVYLDLLGPISGTNRSSKFVITAFEGYSPFLSVLPLKSKKATVVAKTIHDIIDKGLTQIGGWCFTLP